MQWQWQPNATLLSLRQRDNAYDIVVPVLMLLLGNEVGSRSHHNHPPGGC
jgi:hypothetical protein